MNTSNGFSISSGTSRVSLKFKEFGSAISLRKIQLFARNKCHGTINASAEKILIAFKVQ